MAIAFLSMLPAYAYFLAAPAEVCLINGSAGDGVRHCLPLYSTIHEQGGPVLRDPHQFAGLPVYALSQFAANYPPVLLLSLCLPPATAYGAITILHAVLGFVGVVALLRRWRVCLGVSLAAAALYSHIFCQSHLIYSGPSAWWPWVHLAAWSILRGDAAARGRWCLWGALFLYGLASSGQPQFALYALIITALLLLAETIWLWRGSGAADLMARLGWLIAGAMLALLLSAVHVWPAMAFLPTSVRSSISSPWFSLKSNYFKLGDYGTNLSAIWHPSAQAFLLVWAGLLAATAVRVPRRFSLTPSVIVLAIGVLYAMGDVTPVAYAVQTLVPILTQTRSPNRIMISAWGLALFLGAIGWNRILSAHPEEIRWRRFFAWWAGIMATLSLLSLLLTYGRGPLFALGRVVFEDILKRGDFGARQEQMGYVLHSVSLGVSHGWWVMGYAGALVAGVLLVLRRFPAARAALPVAALLWICWKTPFPTMPLETLMPRNALVRHLQARQEEGPFRVLNTAIERTRLIEVPIAQLYRIDLADGVEPMIPFDYWDAWSRVTELEKPPVPNTGFPAIGLPPDRIVDFDLLRDWNVQYVLSTVPAASADLRLVRRYENLPAYVFPKGRGEFANVYLYELNPPAKPRLRFAGGKDGAAEILTFEEKRSSMTASVRTERPATLEYAIHRGIEWRAWVDGREVPLASHPRSMLAVDVPPGTHQVTFRLVPRSLHLGLGVSVAAWIGWFAALLWVHRNRTRPVPSQAPKG